MNASVIAVLTEEYQNQEELRLRLERQCESLSTSLATVKMRLEEQDKLMKDLAHGLDHLGGPGTTQKIYTDIVNKREQLRRNNSASIAAVTYKKPA